MLTCQESLNCECRKENNQCQCTEPGKLLFTVCDGDECCNFGRRRLLLETADTFVQNDNDDDEMQTLVKECGEYDYETRLYVDSHLYAIASPMRDAETAGCPFVVTHSVYTGEEESGGGTTNKEMHIWTDKTKGETYFADGLLLEGSMRTGTFKFMDLVRAYQEADAGGGGGDVYNVVTNNCGHFIVNLAKALGIQIDASMMAFVVRRLLQKSGKYLVARIRSSVDYSSLFEGHRHLREESATDEKVVELLVQRQALELY